MVKVKIKKLKFFFLILCIIQLLYIFHFRSGFKYEIIKNPFDKNSGIYHSVSPEIVESQKILQKNEVSDFMLSETIQKDDYLYQRIIEFNYPIRFKKSSELIFYLYNEIIPDSCIIIEKGKYFKVVKC